MAKYYINERRVIIDSIHSAADYVDSYIESAHYEDTGEELTDKELDQLSNDFDFHDAWFEKQIDKADQLYDQWKDSQLEND